MLGSVGSARSFARAQLVYRLGTRDSGFGFALLGASLGLSGSQASSADLG